MTRLLSSLVLAIAGYLLGIVAEATRDSGLAIYVVSCLTKIICFLVAVPLAYSAGRKIRKETNITGIPGLRFASWIMYGVALVHFALFFQWGLVAAGDTRIPDGQIALDAAIFLISSMLMIAESWNSYKSKDLASGEPRVHDQFTSISGDHMLFTGHLALKFDVWEVF